MHHRASAHPQARRARALVAAVAAGALLVLAACGGDTADESTAGATPTDAAPPATVTMRLVAFGPAALTVDAGTTVTWMQQDPGAHTVTSGTVAQGTAGVTTAPDGRFDSGDIASGGTFRFTFDQPGTYSYFCSIHPATMRGEVRVT